MIPHISLTEMFQVAMVVLIVGFLLGASMMHWLNKTFKGK